MEDQIERLIQELTLEEKIKLLAGADNWHSANVDRLGIPALKMTDGPNGARGAGENKGPSSAAFPVGVAMAATWNTDLIEEVGQALGEETKAKGAHILLGPTVNIHRSPLAGRNFECFSEDPYLSARMAVSYIKGLQRQGVGACIKHFICNDSEFERTSMSSEVRERALREIYLPPFRAAVKEAQPWSVMSSYNRINGVYASENPYTLLDILKGEWGFEGLVISDWFGTYSRKAAEGGLDLEMPGPARWMGETVLEDVKTGRLDEVVVDDKIRRLLHTIQSAGSFENPELQPEQAIDRPEHRELIHNTAAEAAVLLKNEEKTLPLDLAQIKSIAVIGENARWAPIMGGGSSRVTPHYVVSPLDGIRQRAGDQAEINYSFGCQISKSYPQMDTAQLRTEPDGEKGLKLETFENPELRGEPVHTEITERMEQVWFGDDQAHAELSNFSARLSGIWRPNEDGYHSLNLACVGKSRLIIDGSVEIDLWPEADAENPEMQFKQGDTKVELHTGQDYKFVVEYASIPGPHWRNLRVGYLPPVPENPVEEAAQLAANSDVAIVFAGTNSDWESEGRDRDDMELPGDQVRLIEAVVAANPKTVVVLNTGSPITMPWLDKVAAVVQAWFPGQESGNAIAAVLFGDANPSGKLPVTFPKRLKDNPAHINYPGENGKVYYGEGIFVGYRYYDTKDIEPLFPFGHGLSYTSFEYQGLNLSADEIVPGETLQVEIELHNSGDRSGKEVVQVYVRDIESSLARPEKELKAFTKVELQPGETRKLSLTLDEEALAAYDPGLKRWSAEEGEFELLVGSSSRDIRLRTRFLLGGKTESELSKESRLHVGLPLRTLIEDPQGKAVLEQYFSQFLNTQYIEMVSEMSLENIAAQFSDFLPPHLLRSINEDLSKL